MNMLDDLKSHFRDGNSARKFNQTTHSCRQVEIHYKTQLVGIPESLVLPINALHHNYTQRQLQH